MSTTTDELWPEIQSEFALHTPASEDALNEFLVQHMESLIDIMTPAHLEGLSERDVIAHGLRQLAPIIFHQGREFERGCQTKLPFLQLRQQAY